MKLRGIKTNLIFNVVGPLLSLILLIIVTPIYISYIGDARYGLLSITWRLLGYFGFLDLGLSRASANALSKRAEVSSGEERAKVLVTALSINVCLGTVGAGIFYLFGTIVIEHLLTLPAILKPEIDQALPWVACLVPLALIGGIGFGALESRERFLAANVLQVLGATVGVVAPVLCAAFISPSLTVVLPAAVIARALSVLLSLGFALRGESHLSLKSFDWKWARALLGFGGWVSFCNFIGLVIQSSDQLVIGSVLGVAAVAHYAVPMSLVVRSQLLAPALSRTLFPRMSRSTPAEAKELAGKALVILAYIYGAVCASAMILARPLLELWMGKDFGSIAGPIAELLLIGGWTNSMMFVFIALLDGQGRPDITAKINLLIIFPYLIILWLLVNQFGLLGAATTWSLMVTIVTVFLFTAARFSPARLVQMIPPLGFILAAYLYVCIWPPAIFHAVIAAGITGAGVCASTLLFDKYSREFVASFLFPRRSQNVI